MTIISKVVPELVTPSKKKSIYLFIVTIIAGFFYSEKFLQIIYNIYPSHFM